MTRQTHTYASLPVSPAAYDEVARKLRDAGYDHAFLDDGHIDMHGIALEKEAEVERPEPPACDVVSVMLQVDSYPAGGHNPSRRETARFEGLYEALSEILQNSHVRKLD